LGCKLKSTVEFPVQNTNNRAHKDPNGYKSLLRNERDFRIYYRFTVGI